MYSRSYYPEIQGHITTPENYDGTAFSDKGNEEITERDSPCCADVETSGQSNGTGGGIFSALTESPLLSGIFGKGGLLGGIGLSAPHIGTEEILILATAAFLFFSKSGDRECAIILLLLLFIN